MSVKYVWLVLLLLLLSLCGTAWSAGNNVRVVLDTSRSMGPTSWNDRGVTRPPSDPGRMAILATMLLYDLAIVEDEYPEIPDRMEVFPFDRNYTWPAGASPPVHQSSFGSAALGSRDAFWNRLKGLQTIASNTYFYPGVKRAVDSLKGKSGRSDVSNVIVLITDGVPQPENEAADLELLQALLPEMDKHDIRLNVIAFGPDYPAPAGAAPSMTKRDFFGQLQAADSAGVIEMIKFDPTGARLLDYMIEIFKANFAYTGESWPVTAGTANPDLDNNSSAERVAVVALTPPGTHSGSPPAPSLQLWDPQANAENPWKEEEATQEGASYRVRWVLSPSPGVWEVRTNGPGPEVAVLRPIHLDLDLLPPYAGYDLSKAMANTDYDAKMLIKCLPGAAGTSCGIPVEVGPQYRWTGPRDPGATSTECSHSLGGEPFAGEFVGPAPSTKRNIAPTGRTYDVKLRFPDNTEDNRQPYQGHVELRVLIGQRMVGHRLCSRDFSVTVYPELRIQPVPGTGDLGSTADPLDPGETGVCTKPFRLELRAGELESAGGGPTYKLKAHLQSSVPNLATEQFDGARFTLRGKSISFAGRPSDWTSGPGLELTAEQLVGMGPDAEMQLCVDMGEQTKGDPTTPVGLEVKFTLDHHPYDQFDVVKPYRANAYVQKPPGPNWLSCLPCLLLLLAAPLLLLRHPLRLPPDLRYALAPQSNPFGFEAFPIPSPRPLAGLLGRGARKLLDDKEQPIGYLRPENQELYAFRPVKGVKLVDRSGKAPDKAKSGAYLLTAHEVYRLQREHGEDLMLRMEFS